MKAVVYYCYDAYCGWCYGFSPVIKKIASAYKDKLSFEVLSGGMIPKEYERPISAIFSTRIKVTGSSIQKNLPLPFVFLKNITLTNR